MNYLAHIYLSWEDPKLTIGNFMADDIKGNKYLTLPPKIQQGVLLHRHIDSFTDQHPVVKKSTARLHNQYGHYSGVIVDIFYDHFLAKNWNQYHNIALLEYTLNFYSLLEANKDLLSNRILQMLPVMKKYNWLYSYRTISGIESILEQMNRFRTQNRSNMHLAVHELTKHYTDFETEFATFFNEIMISTKSKIEELNIKYNQKS